LLEQRPFRIEGMRDADAAVEVVNLCELLQILSYWQETCKYEIKLYFYG